MGCLLCRTKCSTTNSALIRAGSDTRKKQRPSNDDGRPPRQIHSGKAWAYDKESILPLQQTSSLALECKRRRHNTAMRDKNSKRARKLYACKPFGEINPMF